MDLSLTLVLFCILILIIFYKFLNIFLFKPYSIDRSLLLQQIPGHYIPFIGEILSLRRAGLQNRLLEYFQDQHQKYGPYYRSQIGPMARLVTCDPSLITYILKKNVKSYHRTTLARDFLGRLLGMKNLLMSEGEVHSTQRKLMQPVFQHQNLVSMENLMVEITSILIEKWNAMIAEQQNKSINLEMRNEMSALTLDIVTGCVFGTGLMNDQSAHDTIHKNIAISQKEMEHRFFSLIGVLPVIKELPLRSKLNIDRARRNINLIVEKIIDDRRQGVTHSACKGPDLLDLLLSAESEGQKLTHKEVVQESMTIVIAGHETTSTLMTWTIYCLTQYPVVLLKLQKEIDSVLHGEPPTAETLSKLTYTEAVLKETLRLHSPVPTIIRQTMCDNTIVAEDGKEIFIKKGTEVVIDFHTLHHSEKYYPNATTFDPTRFFSNGSEKEQTPSTASIFLPFSSGTRNCIGQGFAMIEAKIMLSMIVQQFEFDLIPGQQFIPEVFVTLRPKYGVWIRLKCREQLGMSSSS